MYSRLQIIQLIVVALGAFPISELLAVECRTGDGLSLRLDEKTGCVTGIALGTRTIPLSAGGRPLVHVREYVAVDNQTARQALTVDAEADAALCRPAAMADWDAKTAYVRRVVDPDDARNHVLRIGDGEQPGAGLAVADLIKVVPGEILHASWRSRTVDSSLSYIVCWRLFDTAGTDVTADVTPPPEWRHSPYSNAHYRVDVRNAKDGQWQTHSVEYTVPPGVAAAQFSLRVFRGGTLQADVDDLRLDVRPPPGRWTPPIPLFAPLKPQNGRFVQRAAMPDESGTVVTRVTAEDDAIHIDVSLEPEGRQFSRCFELTVTLPLLLRDCRWRAAPGGADPIDGAPLNAGTPMSIYPLASVDAGDWSMAVARDIGEPGWQTFTATPEALTSTFQVGVSSQAPYARTSFSTLIYQHAPEWGFRAALARYYALLPHRFATPLRAAGSWTLRLPPLDTPDISDFGLRFLECGRLDAASRRFCREHGLLTFFYAEPWGLRQVFQDADDIGDIPPYEERLAMIRQWAGETDTDRMWRSMPRNLAARAVLNSFIGQADGPAVTQFDKYTNWAAWWQLNTDPDIPEPNRATTCMRYEITPALTWADGIYLDSLSQQHTSYEDHRPDHLAAANLPLGFSRHAVPVVISGFAHTEFITQLRDQLHNRGKFLMMNLFPPATRLYGHLGDITGCELLGNEQDDVAMQQRVYAYRRTVSNLLQWKGAVRNRVPAMTTQQLEAYIQNQLFYGFWPGISTAGGGSEPGYAHMHRYFRDPTLFERDRDLFRTYIPIVARLQQAGWEPITAVRAESPHVRIERFGTPPRPMLLTVRNTGAAHISTKLTLDRAWWAAHADTHTPAECQDLLLQTAVPLQTSDNTVEIPVDLAPSQTTVLELRPRQLP